ncbi:flippase-like domain-containing protein [Roseibium denhamense]|uniref:Uncharacterized membrane protein YbhN, UPF0104 family n=1 Tax=Roseibium denhamense TaxID=76305 RepID=A0ABY1NU16_9HYPH|nr:lysylphosphatidylglycerol synthase domain-containing protein [Roseibium denhamense]MTI05382.1 flippase-like domain-containing protein [Roseibium denhamense]SMP17514.1 Uncharacterized membrane protein YbhN, UPF0104 family [Roseibium denhamense]
MRIDLKRCLVAAGVSGCFFAGVLWVAQFQGFDFSHLDPLLITALFTIYVVLTVCRGLLLRALAPIEKHLSVGTWFKLAARHQILFTLVPSGAGDIGFPHLLKKMAGLPIATGVRIIAQVRMRDAAVLGSLGLLGLISQGFNPFLGSLGLAITAVALWFIDDIAAFGLKTAASLSPNGKVAAFLQTALSQKAPHRAHRLLCTLLSIVIWTVAASGVGLAFYSAGHPLSVSECMLVLALLNVIGAVAVSIGGLGVAEAGVAGALIAMGTQPQEAAAVAIVVRPLMLFTLLCASAVLDSAAGLFIRQNLKSDVSRP